MRRSFVTLIALALLAAGVATAFHAHDAGAQAPPAGQGAPPPPPREGGPPPGGPGQGGPRRPYVWDPARADTMVMRMLEGIKGKEDMPAESVYKNIKILNGMPAKRLPEIMVRGFGRSLGMGCDGCHVHRDFPSDENDNKKVARQMWAMSKDLNNKYLPAMKELADDMPVVSCWTCHRGQHDPDNDADHPHTPHDHEGGAHPEPSH